jgi:outer membrane protein OmpA-like peptidoglycan-associated protein
MAGHIHLYGQGTYCPPNIPAKAIKDLDDAIMVAESGKTDIAVAKIQQLIAKYPTWTLPPQKLSRIYYRAGRKSDALKTLEASIAIDTNSQIQQLYTMGRLYEETGEFNKAKSVYQTVLKKINPQDELAKQVNKNLDGLEEQIRLSKQDYAISVKPMVPGVNTKYEEALGRWMIDGRSLIFTRLLNNQEDLFLAKFDSLDHLLKVEELSFNTAYSEGGHTISPDGKFLVFTSCLRPDGLGSCDLYLSVLTPEGWTEPANMGPKFNGPSWDSQPCFGLDGMSIYFASTRPGGFGGSDIWMVRQLPSGDWSNPVNAGSVINTANNESSPFIHFDGRTMYFMRDGKGGLGGFDLYLSHLGIDGKWKTPENMGSPINSRADEGALALHPDGVRAVITRSTPGQGNDLFEFLLPDQFKSVPVQVMYANVKSIETNQPVKARLEIFDANGKDTIRTSQAADENGNITLTLDRNKSYGLIAAAIGYIMYSSSLPPDDKAIRYLDIKMTPLAVAENKTIVLQNIFFDFGSATLLPSSDPELHRLYLTMKENKTMNIEIRGHTDNVGSDESNQQLSENRAKAVYNYLIEKGIEKDRISYKGFGETQPVATNETEAGRSQNRRTEFFILKI